MERQRYRGTMNEMAGDTRGTNGRMSMCYAITNHDHGRNKLAQNTYSIS